MIPRVAPSSARVSGERQREKWVDALRGSNIAIVVITHAGRFIGARTPSGKVPATTVTAMEA